MFVSFYKSFTSFYAKKAACARPAPTFVPLFHQPNKVMRILAFLLFFQAFFACQQGPEIDRSLEANLSFKSTPAGRQRHEKTQPLAADIIFKSVDGGQTWQDVSEGLPVDLKVSCVFANGDEVFLGSESGLYRSGIAPVDPLWEKEIFLWKSITDIFPGRAGPYACSYGDGFFQELAGTRIWMPMHNALKDTRVSAVLETPDGTIFVGCHSGIFKSTDGRKTWKQVFADGMVTSLVAAGEVLVGGGSQGLLRSTDGGEHWDWVLTEDGSIRKAGCIGDRFVSISNGGGPFKEVVADPEGKSSKLRASTDGGKTWQRMDQDLSLDRFKDDMSERLSMTRFIYDIEQAGKYLFCSVDAGIFRSSDQGNTWELVRPATGMKFFNLAVSGQVVYAVTGAGGC